jgi:ParB/RepB/Spo0J family partition protein
MQKAHAEKGEMWQVPVDGIHVLDGFNVRIVDTPRAKEAHDELVNSILENGFYQDKPLAGYVAVENGEEIIYITDGHRRFAAVQAAIEAGAPIEKLPVVVKPQAASLEDLTVAMMQSNSGEPLTMYEQALLVKRLVNYNMAKDDIAKRLSKTPRHIDNLLVLAGVPAKVRDMIVAEDVSATQALKEMRKNPAKAVQVLSERVKAANAKGKTKAAPKDSGPKMKATKLEFPFGGDDEMGVVLKGMASNLRELVPHDQGSDKIGAAVGKIVVTLYLPAPEPEPKPAPAAKPAKATAAKPAKATEGEKPKRTRKKAETPAPAPEPAPEAAEAPEGAGEAPAATGEADLSDL